MSNVDRRQILTGIIASLGGASVLSGCGEAPSVPIDIDDPAVRRPLGPGGRFYAAHELSFLHQFSDALLPRTDTPGATDVGVPALMDRMMADWASDETRRVQRATINTISQTLHERLGQPFSLATSDRAAAALAVLDDEAFSQGRHSGYKPLKRFVADVYFLTEAGLRDERGYELVPGQWVPSKPLRDAGKTP